MEDVLRDSNGFFRFRQNLAARYDNPTEPLLFELL
jgi:hypothetical protein